MNAANILTISRILAAPILVVLLIHDSFWTSITASIIFTIATITDYLDGYLARKYHLESDLGKLLDPLADKLLVITTLIMLIPLGRVPAWMVAIIIAREIAVTGLRALASEKRIIIEANWLGKYKTAFQCTALIPLLFHYQVYDLQFQQGGEFFLWIALFFTLWSGFDYIFSYAKQAYAL